MNSKLFHTAFLLLLAFFLWGCSGKNQTEVDILRYDRLLFESQPQELASRLEAFSEQFPSPLLSVYPNDSRFMSMVQGFVNDSTIQQIYTITNSRYNDLSWLEKEIGKTLGKAQQLYPDISLNHVAAYVSGTFDYNTRVTADRESSSLVISLDQYALPQMNSYFYFGLPMFLVSISDSAYLATDIMAELARQYIAAPDENNVTLLDIMVMEGKVLYFLDQVMPDKEDHLKMRYSEEQLKWCQRNEAMIWAYLIQHNMLYEKDFTRYHNFIDEAPQTNAFRDSSPRTPQYIGWQIVRHYMENNKCSMQELFENTDSQSILSASKYKP